MTDTDYERIVQVLDQVGEDETHPLASLMADREI